MTLISGHVCGLLQDALFGRDSHAAQVVPPRSDLKSCDRLSLSAVCMNAGATNNNYKLGEKSHTLRAGCAPRCWATYLAKYKFAYVVLRHGFTLSQTSQLEGKLEGKASGRIEETRVRVTHENDTQ